MTTTRTRPGAHGSRLLLSLLAAALGVAIVVAAWQVGATQRPTAADADAARAVAYEEAYGDARTDAFGPAYSTAWDPAFERGETEGRRDGGAAGVAAARAAT